jgi:hypothetical protein
MDAFWNCVLGMVFWGLLVGVLGVLAWVKPGYFLAFARWWRRLYGKPTDTSNMENGTLSLVRIVFPILSITFLTLALILLLGR